MIECNIMDIDTHLSVTLCCNLLLIYFLKRPHMLEEYQIHVLYKMSVDIKYLWVLTWLICYLLSNFRNGSHKIFVVFFSWRILDCLLRRGQPLCFQGTRGLLDFYYKNHPKLIKVYNILVRMQIKREILIQQYWI